MDSVQQIDTALAAHALWRDRLRQAIESGTSAASPAAVGADNMCEFGKWLYSSDPEIVGNRHYGRVRELHALFHKTAGEILALALGGESMRARIALGFGGEFAKCSLQLVAELEEWKAEVQRSTP